MPSYGRAASALVRSLALWAMAVALLSGVCAAQASRGSAQRREVICARYADQAATQAIQAVNGKEVDGRTLNVNEARPREPRGGSRW